jgi:hypothetical protein
MALDAGWMHGEPGERRSSALPLKTRLQSPSTVDQRHILGTWAVLVPGIGYGAGFRSGRGVCVEAYRGFVSRLALVCGSLFLNQPLADFLRFSKKLC